MECYCLTAFAKGTSRVGGSTLNIPGTDALIGFVFLKCRKTYSDVSLFLAKSQGFEGLHNKVNRLVYDDDGAGGALRDRVQASRGGRAAEHGHEPSCDVTTRSLQGQCNCEQVQPQGPM